jgi:putrescine---pyruvate transaminase
MTSAQTLHWQDLDRRHHLHPFTNHADLAARGSRVITRADGVHLWDSEGNRIIDGMAGLWCVNVGYGRRELAEAAHRQMLELPYYNTFFQTATAPAVELAAKLAQVTPEGLNHVFYANSGSEANDTVIKIVRYFWNLMGKPKKKTIISRKYAYHGVTLAVASMSGLPNLHARFDLPLPGFEHVAAPYWYAEGGDADPDEFGRRTARSLEEKILELGPENVAAFIGEPVQGAGGVIVPPESYWPEVQRICREHDVLLVADEVICGFGRTGSWFGSDTFGIRPDLMVIAKGLSSGYVPIAGVMVGDRVAAALVSDRNEFAHGFTYSGHPTACAVALANIEILERERLVERVGEEVAPYFREKLMTLADHPLVGEVRTLGLLGAVELVEDRATRRHFAPERNVGMICRDHCFANNLVMRAIRDIMVLSPPLVIRPEQIDEVVAIARRCLDLTARDLGLRGVAA